MARLFNYGWGNKLGEGAFGSVWLHDNPAGAPFSRQYPTVAIKKITVSHEQVEMKN